MTHTTDQERAEFEAWYASRYGARDFTKALEFARRADAYEVWQAAHRARVVPDEVVEAARQVHRLVRAHAFDMQHDDKAKPMWESCTKDAVRTLQYLVDAAAPQPPDVAPVQMPEPQAEIEVRSMKTYLDLSIHEWRDTLSDGTYNIYTEHQVSTILAQHGIKTK